MKEFSKAGAGAVDPALDGAQLGPADPGDLLVLQSLCPREENGLALLGREPRKSPCEVSQVKIFILSREGREHAGHHAVRVLDLPPPPAFEGVELIAEDREEPRLQAGARLEFVDLAQPPDNRLLHEVVGKIDIAGQRDREGAKPRKGRKQAVAQLRRKNRSRGLSHGRFPCSGRNRSPTARHFCPNRKRHPVNGITSIAVPR